MGNERRKQTAKGRNSFMLYTDSLEVVNDLTDEEAGKLFKKICEFAAFLRDKNKADPGGFDDRILNIAFCPIRNYLLRDWESYLDACKNKNPYKTPGKKKQDDEGDDGDDESD